MFRGPRQLGAVLNFLWAHHPGAVVVPPGGYEHIVAPSLAGLEHHRARVFCVNVCPAGAEMPDGTSETQGVCAQMLIPGRQAYAVGALDCAELAPVNHRASRLIGLKHPVAEPVV